LRYNIVNGAFIDTFASVGSGGFNGPVNLVFGPDRNLYVTSGNSVLRYNGTTGKFIDTFAKGDRPDESLRGLTFGPGQPHPDNDLYVVALTTQVVGGFMTSRVLRYHGTTGALVGIFAPPREGRVPPYHRGLGVWSR
jgi:hypothetical protein